MSLHKAIASGKEHRVEYGERNQPYCKAVDKSCRNHGSCPWCAGNRTNKNKNKAQVAKKAIQEYRKEV